MNANYGGKEEGQVEKRKNPFGASTQFDVSKLPEELQHLTPLGVVLLLRAGFDLAVELSRDHDVALEVTYQALYHLTTDRRWDSTKGLLHAHFLVLVRSAYTELRFGGSREERTARLTFAHTQSKTTGSIEDLAIALEEEPALLERDEDRLWLAQTVLASVARNKLAAEVARLWMERGSLTPRELARLTGASVRDVYNATDLVRYQARKALNALRARKEGGAS
jgi:hypothetical protein